LWISHIISLLWGLLVSEIIRPWEFSGCHNTVGQRYKSIESQYSYKIDIEITYRGRDVFIDIRKAKDNFDKKMEDQNVLIAICMDI